MRTLGAVHAAVFFAALSSVASAQESRPAALSISLPPPAEAPASTFSISGWLRTFSESVRVPDESAWPGDRNETVLQAVRRELMSAHPGQGQALAQVNLLSLIEGAIRKVNDVRRQHAIADARRLVARELAQFCLSHECASPELPSELSPPEGVFLPVAATGTSAGRSQPPGH
jgi:hypothetical protein